MTNGPHMKEHFEDSIMVILCLHVASAASKILQSALHTHYGGRGYDEYVELKVLY